MKTIDVGHWVETRQRLETVPVVGITEFMI